MTSADEILATLKRAEERGYLVAEGPFRYELWFYWVRGARFSTPGRMYVTVLCAEASPTSPAVLDVDWVLLSGSATPGPA